ncbi:MAG: hypothetical protein AAFO07_22060, partial [Bacteroidota bacterium]
KCSKEAITNSPTTVPKITASAAFGKISSHYRQYASQQSSSRRGSSLRWRLQNWLITKTRKFTFFRAILH